MSLVLTQEGAARLWQWLLGLVPPAVANVHLLGMPYIPTHTSTLSALAANEVTGDTGYSPRALFHAAADWTISGLPTGAQAQYITVSWTLVSAPAVYGYYVSDDAFTVSLWAEQFASPWTNPGPPGVMALQLPPTLTSLPSTS